MLRTKNDYAQKARKKDAVTFFCKTWPFKEILAQNVTEVPAKEKMGQKILLLQTRFSLPEKRRERKEKYSWHKEKRMKKGNLRDKSWNSSVADSLNVVIRSSSSR